MNRLLLCALLVAIPLAACKRKPAAGATAPEAPAAPSNPEVDLKALNAAVVAYAMGQLKEPATLDDLVKTGFIKRLPTPHTSSTAMRDSNRVCCAALRSL